MPSSRMWMPAGLLVLVLGAVFGATLADMAHEWWTEPAASQGLILPPLAIYLAWLNKRAWHNAPARTDGRGLALTAAGCLCYLLGNLAAEFFLMRISFVIVLAGLVLSFWGWARLRVLALPILLLATMVPLPSIVYTSLAAPLQLLASDVATRVAQTVGVSVYRDGNLIQLASTTLGVAEACSGLSSLSALIVGSVLLGFLLCETTLTRVLLFLSALPLAVGVNVVRVAGTAIAADYDESLALGFYHSFSGWLVFMAGFGLLYLTGRLLHRLFDPAPTAPPAGAAAAGVTA
ncbi:MAG: exosortase [Bryobacterales bacterium]|nr:exosortase [Bryobacterales bacterium]